MDDGVKNSLRSQFPISTENGEEVPEDDAV